MILICLIIFGISLLYFFLTERVKKFIGILVLQGLLLFIIAFINLNNIIITGFILILMETLLVKAILIPWFINKLRIKNDFKKVHECRVPVFFSVLITGAVIILSFIAGYFIDNPVIQLKFFTIALSTIVGGIYFIIIHKNIFSHLVGLLIIENGVFLFTLAVGGEFPFLVSMAVLIDLLIAVIAIGIFINKIGNTFKDMSVTSLTGLKD